MTTRERVQASRAVQGLPPTVADPSTLDRIAGLLAGAPVPAAPVSPDDAERATARAIARQARRELRRADRTRATARAVVLDDRYTGRCTASHRRTGPDG